LPRIEGLTKREIAIAAFLQPVHSQLCAIAVRVLWKADQLVRALVAALNSHDLIVAATMARSLIETSAAFGCETDAISELWKVRKAQPVPDLDTLAEFAGDAQGIVGQILFGTRLEWAKEPETGIRRTNIMTLIDKAAKLSENKWVRRNYEVLCDTVHPSIGSNRCFWEDEPIDLQAERIRMFRTHRNASGVIGDLPFAVGQGSLWAAKWLGWMWSLRENTWKDLCLTAKTYALPYG